MYVCAYKIGILNLTILNVLPPKSLISPPLYLSWRTKFSQVNETRLENSLVILFIDVCTYEHAYLARSSNHTRHSNIHADSHNLQVMYLLLTF